MKSTYGITEAQHNLPKIVRSKRLTGISRHNKVEAFIIPRDRFESLIETMELMANPEFRKALEEHKSGKAKYLSLAEAEKLWGPD